MKLLLWLSCLLVLTQVIQVQAIFFGLFARGRGFRGFGRSRGVFGRRRGRGGHGRGRGRFGRDLTAVTAPEDQQQEAKVEGLQMDAYFAAVQLGDEDRCGLRLVCELRTMDPAQLGEEENMILALFGADVPSSGRPDSPKRLYDAAAELGSRAGTTEVCAETFQTCQYDSQTLIEAIRTSTPGQ